MIVKLSERAVKAGLVVRDPVSKRALGTGELRVPDGDTYWNRRLRDGDVVVVDEPKGKPKAKEGAAPADAE